MSVSVVVPTIPTRAKLLRKALGSVVLQTRQADAIIVEYDHGRTGAAATKNRGIAKATTEWVAMLDDDDQFLPLHLETLIDCAEKTGADVVYSIPNVPQSPTGVDVHGRYGVPFDPNELRNRSYIQTTTLMRTSLLQSVGGFQCPPGSVYDDWGCFLAMLDAGAKFVHCPEVTFIWNHWGVGTAGVPGNTSGQPDRW
jgi:glycosyltransferase involved in cell wall biosynthesis